MSRLTEKILRGLEDIGYHGPMLNRENLEAAAEVGQKSIDFTKLVNFLTNEIRSLAGIDEEVNAITSPEDSVAFVMEMTSFLKELNCPYTTLTQGLVSERFQSASERFLLLDYLVTELMGARILQEKKPEKKIELKLQETPEGADMRQILQTLRFPKPPPNITIKQLFDKLDTTIPIVVNKAGADLIGKGIFNGHLSEKQWEILNGVQTDLNNEYKIRREMQLTRLDVTIQSFQWSERTKGKDEMFEKIYHDRRKLLKADPEVDISDLLAARTDLAIIEKMSNSSVRKNTQSLIHKVVIGMVPDRGGRSWEQPPPPPEMPSWQQQRSGPAGGGRGGGGGPMGGRGGGQASRGGGQDNRGGYGGRGGGGGGGYNSRDNSRDSSRDRDNYQGGFNKGGFGGGGSNSGYGRGGNSYRGQMDFTKDVAFGNFRGGDSFGRNSRRDSGGSGGYGGSQDYQQNKRPKTYDSYQSNKNTYADQYVQEREHNQQYHRGRGGRGRSNYHRGGGSNYH